MFYVFFTSHTNNSFQPSTHISLANLVVKSIRKDNSHCFIMSIVLYFTFSIFPIKKITLGYKPDPLIVPKYVVTSNHIFIAVDDPQHDRNWHFGNFFSYKLGQKCQTKYLAAARFGVWPYTSQWQNTCRNMVVCRSSLNSAPCRVPRPFSMSSLKRAFSLISPWRLSW